MRRIPKQLFLFASVVLLCGLFSAFSLVKLPAPITKTGLTSVGVKQIDSCLLVYGINNTTNSLEVEMYDPQLRMVHQFSEKISGFIPYKVDLQYQSDTRSEFVVGDNYNSKQQFIFLDHELKSYYKSAAASKVTVLTNSSSKTLSEYRIDDYAWEIRTEIQDLGASGKRTLTSLYQYGIKLQSAFPVRELNRGVVLDSFAVEYAKVFLVQDNKVYVYVNESTAKGSQFIYCFSGFDGSLIYKTQLVASFNDAQLEDVSWDIKKFEKSDAAIFSNYFWDEKTKSLLVGGTWLADSGSHTGIFLLQLNDKGIISASSVDYDYWYETPKPPNNVVDFHAFSRNSNTWYCIKEMGYQGDGTLSVLVEAYAKVHLFGSGGIYQQDDFRHYFSVEAYYFNMKAGSITRKCEGYPVRVVDWANGHRLDSIGGYIQGKTRMGDKKFENDVNKLCDGTMDSYFHSVIRGPGKNATKVLTREPVITDGTKENYAYFGKQKFSMNNSNRIAFLEPTPIRNQNFSEHTDYYAVDASRLYRILYTKDGYVLSITKW